MDILCACAKDVLHKGSVNVLRVCADGVLRECSVDTLHACAEDVLPECSVDSLCACAVDTQKDLWGFHVQYQSVIFQTYLFLYFNIFFSSILQIFFNNLNDQTVLRKSAIDIIRACAEDFWGFHVNIKALR